MRNANVRNDLKSLSSLVSNKSFIDQACSMKTAGYWPCSFLPVYGPEDFVKVYKMFKTKTNKQTNWANIKPSQPPAWSITYKYSILVTC